MVYNSGVMLNRAKFILGDKTMFKSRFGRFLIEIGVLIGFVFLMMYAQRTGAERLEKDNEVVGAGVVVHGFNSEGYILNTNAFSVRVESEVLREGQPLSELRLGYNTLQPNQKVNFFVGNRNRFKIYTGMTELPIYTASGTRVKWLYR